MKAGTDGSIQTLIPDNGEALTVSKDRTGSAISPNTSRRVMSNYETLSNGHTATAVIYSLQSLVTPTPKPADDPTYRDGLKHDPVDVVSIWLGRGYLNMILNLKVNGGKQHVFGIVEDLSEFETNGTVNMLSVSYTHLSLPWRFRPLLLWHMQPLVHFWNTYFQQILLCF